MHPCKPTTMKIILFNKRLGEGKHGPTRFSTLWWQKSWRTGKGWGVNPWGSLFLTGLPDSSRDSNFKVQPGPHPHFYKLPIIYSTLFQYAVTKYKPQGFWTTILLHVSFPYNNSSSGEHIPLFLELIPLSVWSFWSEDPHLQLPERPQRLVNEDSDSGDSQPGSDFSALQFNSFKIFGKSRHLPGLLPSSL